MKQLEDPKTWQDSTHTQNINKKRAFLQKSIEEWEHFNHRIQDVDILLVIAEEEEDKDSFIECSKELKLLEKMAEKLELKVLFDEKIDPKNAYLSIYSGAGGTEACDWVSMLSRMYQRYTERQGYKISTLERTDGDEAGIKSITFHIEGPLVYGYLKSENGVHRLVRISPFDSNARRHTSFAAVSVWPEIDENIEIKVRTEDIKVDTYRAGGAGGQHINKTDSAVRMTHLSTGIVVQCQSERSQHANKDKAMKMLQSALYEREEEAKQKEKDKQNANKKANEWGSQIRSYIMHPYQMVKDHRTGFESGQVQKIMDGDLENFIAAFLKLKREEK